MILANNNILLCLFQGYGMSQDDDIAEHYWLLAGNMLYFLKA